MCGSRLLWVQQWSVYDCRAQAESLTSDSLLPQLPLLNEAPKHLCLHEDLQEASETLGGDRLAESLTLQGPLLSLGGGQEEGVVTHDLHKETDKGLRHHLIQRAALLRGKQNGSGENSAVKMSIQ